MENNFNRVCASCGSALGETQKFCSNCGAMNVPEQTQNVEAPQVVEDNLDATVIADSVGAQAPVADIPAAEPATTEYAAPVAQPAPESVNIPASENCPVCGNNMVPGQVFCARCGYRKEGVAPVAPAYAANPYPNNAAQPVNPYANYNPQMAPNAAKPKSKAVPIIIACVAGVIALIIAIVIGAAIAGSSDSSHEEKKKDRGPNFTAIYTEYCDSKWAELGSDGSYLSIDSNPYDFDDEGMYYLDAFYAVEKVNQELGLPDYVWKEMGETSGLDGRLTETFEDIGITVTWKYHPDNGFEVTYRKIAD